MQVPATWAWTAICIVQLMKPAMIKRSITAHCLRLLFRGNDRISAWFQIRTSRPHPLRLASWSDRLRHRNETGIRQEDKSAVGQQQKKGKRYERGPLSAKFRAV